MLITTELTEVILLKNLKIIIISIVIVMFTLLLVSCGKDSTDEPDVSGVVSTSEETETTTLSETETETVTETVTEPPKTTAPTKAKKPEKTTVKKTTTTKKQTVTEAPDNSADGCIDDGLVY